MFHIFGGQHLNSIHVPHNTTKELESSLQVQTAQLKILTNCTEPLSLSYRQSDVQDALVLASMGSTLGRRTPQTETKVTFTNSPPQLPLSSVLYHLVLTLWVPAACCNTAISKCLSCFSKNLCLVPVKAHSCLFHVLRHSPSLMAPPDIGHHYNSMHSGLPQGCVFKEGSPPRMVTQNKDILRLPFYVAKSGKCL